MPIFSWYTGWWISWWRNQFHSTTPTRKAIASVDSLTSWHPRDQRVRDDKQNHGQTLDAGRSKHDINSAEELSSNQLQDTSAFFAGRDVLSCLPIQLTSISKTHPLSYLYPIIPFVEIPYTHHLRYFHRLYVYIYIYTLIHIDTHTVYILICIHIIS